MYDYHNDNDIPAARMLNDEDRVLDAILARIDERMNDLGEVPATPRHFLDWK